MKPFWSLAIGLAAVLALSLPLVVLASQDSSSGGSWHQRGVGVDAVAARGLEESQPEAQAQPGRSAAHQRMHDLMDSMMGAGHSERMHASVGAEEMMEQCSAQMLGSDGGMMGSGHMGTGGMMGGDQGHGAMQGSMAPGHGGNRGMGGMMR